MRQPPMPLFYRRLAVAAGFSVLPLLAGAGSDTGEDDVACLENARAGDGCIGAADALEAFQNPQRGDEGDSCEVTAVLGEGTVSEGYTCCYPVRMICDSVETGNNIDYVHAGCMGRPFTHDGRPIVAALRRGGRPLRGAAPDLAGLDPDRRALLAHFWTGVALAEHASIAEFHRIALELLRFGAPPELLRRAQVAAVDEARHGSRCLALASAYAGERLDFGAMPIGGQVELAPDLPTLAAVTARDGCVAETCSAWLYGRLLLRAKDSAVRTVIAGVVRDETRHAELAWATLRWALAAGGKDAQEAVRIALATPPPATADTHRANDPLLAAHGWAPAELQDGWVDEAWNRLVRPLGAALLDDVQRTENEAAGQPGAQPLPA